MWWYHSTKAAKIIWVTLDGAMHWASISCQNTLLGASISVIFPHKSWVISLFVSNFVAMATRVGRGRICVTSFNSPTLKTARWTQDLLDLVYNRVMANFISNFVAMATRNGPFKIWLTSLDSLIAKPPVRRKHLGDISYTSRVIADFVLNFVAMATGVGRGRIFLASFNSPTPKTPCYTQRSPRYLVYKPSYRRFRLKFRCHGNGGWSR